MVDQYCVCVCVCGVVCELLFDGIRNKLFISWEGY
jgi:hypothetical protein